jgi:hypothetical protein
MHRVPLGFPMFCVTATAGDALWSREYELWNPLFG